MAKATYESLTRDEQSRLDSIFRECPHLKEEQNKFISFAEIFRVSEDVLPFDLSARIAHRLAQPSPAVLWHRRPGVYAAVIATVLLMVGIYTGVMLTDVHKVSNVHPMATAPDVMPLAETGSAPNSGDLSVVLAKAEGFVASGQGDKAAGLLRDAVEQHRDASRMGEALQLLADIEYRQLQQYDRAFVAYDRLYASYPDTFSSRPENEVHYGLLAETKDENYEPLRRLYEASDNTVNGFNTLETLITRYPNTSLASAAVNEMRTLVKGASGSRDLSIVEKLELVRDRCSDTVAVAQVDLMLGRHYWDDLNDRVCAMEAYTRAAGSDHVVLSHQAHEALSRME